MPERRRNVVGQAIRWVPEEVAALAIVAPSEASTAATLWQQVAPRAWKELITAGLGNSRFTFDPARVLYRVNGRQIAATTLKKTVNTVLEAFGGRMQRMTDAMLEGSMTLGEWQVQMAAQIKQMHTTAMIVGKGGVPMIEREDVLFLEGELRFQYERLGRFALQVERGEVTAGTPETIKGRVDLYARAAGPTYEDARHVAAENVGVDMERRILGAAEHCETCLDQAGMGWQPMGTLAQIGDSECKWNCRCHFEFKPSQRAVEVEERLARAAERAATGEQASGSEISRTVGSRRLAELVRQAFTTTR